ncbi:MAG: hypothetical protein ABL868_08405, partial [Sulfuriferula sp.]
VPQAQGHAIAVPMTISALTTWVMQHHARDIRQSSVSLLGIYATHLATHNAIKQVLTHAPWLLNNSTLLTTDLSGISEKIQKLELGHSPVHASFTRYHQTLQAISKTADPLVNWQTLNVREAQFRQTLRQLIKHSTT